MGASKVQEVSIKAFGLRAREARAVAEVRRARAGQLPSTAVEMSADMSRLLGETVSDRDIGKWFRGEAVPGSLARVWAFATVLGVDAGWLAFGVASQAPAPGLEAHQAPPVREVQRGGERVGTPAKKPKKRSA